MSDIATDAELIGRIAGDRDDAAFAALYDRPARSAF